MKINKMRLLRANSVKIGTLQDCLPVSTFRVPGEATGVRNTLIS